MILMALSCTGAFTPLVWNMQGRLSESYPEFFFLIILIPAAAVIIAAGAAHAGSPERWARDARVLFWLGTATALAFWLYGAAVILPTGPALPFRFGLLTAVPISGTLVIYGWLTRN